MDNNVPLFSKNPSQAQVFLTEDRAETVRRMLRPQRLTLRMLLFVRPPSEPLRWRLADDQETLKPPPAADTDRF